MIRASLPSVPFGLVMLVAVLLEDAGIIGVPGLCGLMLLGGLVASISWLRWEARNPPRH